jgi:hypothetical protein
MSAAGLALSPYPSRCNCWAQMLPLASPVQVHDEISLASGAFGMLPCTLCSLAAVQRLTLECRRHACRACGGIGVFPCRHGLGVMRGNSCLFLICKRCRCAVLRTSGSVRRTTCIDLPGMSSVSFSLRGAATVHVAPAVSRSLCSNGWRETEFMLISLVLTARSCYPQRGKVSPGNGSGRKGQLVCEASGISLANGRRCITCKAEQHQQADSQHDVEACWNKPEQVC